MTQPKTRVEEAAAELEPAVSNDDVSKKPVWAGTGVGLVTESTTAGDVVRRIAAEAERVLRERCQAIVTGE